jgi:hypothetical protein
MNIGSLVKWGVIILVAYLAWQWISNNLLNSSQAQPQGVPYGQWAYPLYRPYWGAGPWVNPINIGRYGPSRGRWPRRPMPYGS